ncbi:hypothetical protein Efla_002454 [Eimeria flavescens]
MLLLGAIAASPQASRPKVAEKAKCLDASAQRIRSGVGYGSSRLLQQLVRKVFTEGGGGPADATRTGAASGPGNFVSEHSRSSLRSRAPCLLMCGPAHLHAGLGGTSWDMRAGVLVVLAVKGLEGQKAFLFLVVVLF